jgi:Protein of unknown function (DUF2281)
MIETTILEYLHKLPDSLQQEVLHYTQFLLETHTIRSNFNRSSHK